MKSYDKPTRRSTFFKENQQSENFPGFRLANCYHDSRDFFPARTGIKFIGVEGGFSNI